MKKIFAVVICAILMCSFSTVALATQTDKQPEIVEYDILLHGDESADLAGTETTPQMIEDAPADGYSQTDMVEVGSEQFANAGELFQYWQESRPNYEASPYPNYVCGVWSTDGGIESLTFAVTKDEAGEAGKDEILSLIQDKSTVSFTYQSYPFAELWAIQLELQQRLGDETGTYSIGIHEMDNVIHIGYDETNENSEAFIEECFNRFGNRIVFESGDGITLASTAEIVGGLDGGSNGWVMWTFSMVLVAGAGAYVLINRTHLIPAMQTVNGTVVTQSSVPSRKAVVAAIKKSESIPSQNTFESILDKIDSPRE